jgi:hypothetical protein
MLPQGKMPTASMGEVAGMRDCGRLPGWSPTACHRRPVRCVTMGAWGTGAFENDSALDLLGDIVDGRFSFERLVQGAEAAYLDHETGVAVVVLVELVLAGRGLRAMPVTDGLSVDLVPQIVSDDQAAWLLGQMPRVLGHDSEEHELWSQAAPETFVEWVGHVNAAIADLRRVLGPGEHHPELF